MGNTGLACLCLLEREALAFLRSESISLFILQNLPGFMNVSMSDKIGQSLIFSMADFPT